jgi:hypothetical protein
MRNPDERGDEVKNWRPDWGSIGHDVHKTLMLKGLPNEFAHSNWV